MAALVQRIRARAASLPTFDIPFLLILLLLLSYGLIMLFSAGYAVALYRRGDAYTYIRPQLLFAALGVLAMYAASLVDYHVWHRLAWPMLGISLLLLAIVLFMPGKMPSWKRPVSRRGRRLSARRSYRYGVEEPWFFYHLGENMIKAEFADNWSQIVFRVKPAADGPDYREKFLREIAPKLDTDNAFVADAAPYTEQQLQFEVMNGDTDKVNSQAVVVLFLLVNVFLGLIGTFWFRTRRRRSEIALRMAMGSTRGGVFRLLIGEGLLLLALVTLPAMVVCYNVGMAEFTIGRTSLISTWPIEWSVIRFLAGSLGAWLLIALMVVIGIWFPARQAMKIEPAEALHEE